VATGGEGNRPAVERIPNREEEKGKNPGGLPFNANRRPNIRAEGSEKPGHREGKNWVRRDAPQKGESLPTIHKV